jgi:hypothetical protein
MLAQEVKLKIRLSVVLPTIYFIVEGFLLGSCFFSLGHWFGCDYIYLLMKPAFYLIPRVYILGFVLALSAGLAQYALLGYLLDKLVRAAKSRDKLS